MMSGWFRDWSSPLAQYARNLWVPHREEWAALKRAPELHEPTGLMGGNHPKADT
jgi:hypothetical protein